MVVASQMTEPVDDAPDFDAMCDLFTSYASTVANWKHAYQGAAYSTRLKSAIADMKFAIAEAEKHPEIGVQCSDAESGWLPIDAEARDGREVLLRRMPDGPIHAGYFGLAQFAFGAGASTMYPWTVLDNTNGVNHLSDGGETGVTHYAPLVSPPSEAGREMVHRTSDAPEQRSGHPGTEDAARTVNEILDYFQDTDRDPGGDWAFPDDFSSLCLDYRDRQETAFWLDIERDGTIRIIWKPMGRDLKSLTFVAASPVENNRTGEASASLDIVPIKSSDQGTLAVSSGAPSDKQFNADRTDDMALSSAQGKTP